MGENNVDLEEDLDLEEYAEFKEKEKELDEHFEAIDKLFVARDGRNKKLAAEDKELDEHFEAIDKLFVARDGKRKNAGLEYEKIELRSEPGYDVMHAKNLKVTSNCVDKLKSASMKLLMGVVAVTAVTSLALSFNSDKYAKKDQVEQPVVGVQLNDDIDDIDDINNINNIDNVSTIKPENLDLSNLTIILCKSTSNVNGIVDTAAKELIGMGVDTRVISSNNNAIEEIDNIKNNDQDREIAVINVDGKANTGYFGTVVMTNYDNNAKSADALAIAIDTENENNFGIPCEIRGGKKDYKTGNRTMVSLERDIKDANIDDVICVTVAPNDSLIDGDINSNNLATAIANGVIRFASLLDNNQRYGDYLRRVEYGDTVDGIASRYGITREFIEDSYDGHILNADITIAVGEKPSNLTSNCVVENKTVTTNPDDITTTVNYYVVKDGDTVSEISNKLNIPLTQLILPNDDPNKINVGDNIGYEEVDGPILIKPNYNSNYK